MQYVNGFELQNGNLKTVPGSHLIRDDLAHGRDDADLEESWVRLLLSRLLCTRVANPKSIGHFRWRGKRTL